MANNKQIVHKSPRKPITIPDNITLSDFVLNHGNKVNNLNYPCFTDAITKESMSHEELRSVVPKIASGLHNNFGVVKDDIVAVFAPNHINFGACLLGIVDLGKSYIIELRDVNLMLINRCRNKRC
jgi:acyl-coenzyme A synthetase/AMP-(fatty) acid ligase